MLERNTNGLIVGLDYKYQDDGSISWRKMIPTEFLAVQKEYEADTIKKFGKPLSEIDKSQVEDRKLLILLGGIKKLLYIRGYNSVEQTVNYVTPEHCVVTCRIEFIGNYETNFKSVIYSDVASASYRNTSGDISQMFLETIAANRALVRCVRGFLNINIVGKDELNSKTPKSEEETAPSPGGVQVHNQLAKMGLTIEQTKKIALTYKKDLKSDPETWKDFSDINPLDVYLLISKISSNKEVKSAKS